MKPTINLSPALRRSLNAIGATGVLLVAVQAHAQYAQRFGAITGGAITFTGNALGLDGDQGSNRPGTRGSIGTFITTDLTQQDGSFPPGTTSDWHLNRSEATLRIPAGARVLHAELVWGGTFASDDASDNVSGSLDDPIAFTTPGGTSSVSPDPLTSKQTGSASGSGRCSSNSGCFYTRSADVTAQVLAAGPGVYAVGGVPATQGTNDNNNPVAGWTLAVAYEDFTKPIRSLTLFQGMELSGGAAASVAGFCTPVSGPLSGRLAVSAMEGDAKIEGDKMLFGPSSHLDSRDDRVKGQRNEDDNFFSGQITTDTGDLDTSGTFGTRNHDPGHAHDGSRQGWDITNVDVSNRLQNNQTQAFAQGTTDGDNYRILALGLQIDIGAPRFDDALAKRVDKLVAAIGDTLTYSVTIDNSSNVTAADNVIFFDTPPAGTSFVPGSFTINGAAAPSANPVTGVPLGTITGGNAVVVTFQAHVDSFPPGPDAHLRSNKARWTFDFVSCAGQPPLAGTSESNTVTTEVPVADLSISKSVLNPPAVPGAQVSYKLAVGNAGPSAVIGALVTDAGTTPALTGVTWTCLANTGASSCAASSGTGPLSSTVNMAVGGGATFTVTGTLPPDTAPGTIANNASIAGPAGIPDPALGNNIASASAPIVQSSDIRLTKSGPSTSAAGNDVTYTLVVTNLGPSDATGVVVTDPTPAGLTLVTPLSGACGSAPGCALAAGASQTMTVTFNIPPAYTVPDPIVNTASATSASTDPAPLNNNAVSATALTAPVADLSIAKTDGITTVTAGGTATYTITITNLGPSVALGSLVEDVFPPATFSTVQWQCVALGTSSCATVGPQTGNISTLIDISPDPANRVTITAQAIVRSDASGTAANTATVTPASGVSDPDSANNLATDTDTIIAAADISVTNVGPAQITPGEAATYTVTVTNNGPSTAVNLPAAFRMFDVAGEDQPDWVEGVTAPAGAVCGKVRFDSAVAMRVILVPVCTLPTLAAGASAVFIVQVRIASAYLPALPATVSSLAVVPPYEVDDPNPSNNQATAVASLLVQADVSITKSGQTAILAGNTRSFILHVANNGPSVARNIVVSDPAPAGVTIVAVDGGPFCSALPCTFPIAAPGENRDIRVDVLVPRDFAGTSFVNTGTITADTPDPDLANNSSAITTFVVPAQTDLSLTKTGPGSAAPGGLLEYDIVFRSLIGDAVDATMTDVLPAGTTFVAITTPPSTTCQTPAVGAAGTITCLSTGVVPDVDVAFHVTALADAQLAVGTVLSNVAAVSPSVPDAVAANDFAVVNTTIAAATDADVSITNVDTPDPVVVGSDVTYTLTVRNAGPASATNVSAIATLPAGLVLVSATPAVGSCTGTTCALGTLAPGATATIAVIATANASGVFTTTATVSATENDPAPANNTATQTTTAGTIDEVDLVVEKLGPKILEIGQVASYVLRVTNRGPGPATNVQLLDTLPPELTLIATVGTCAGPVGLPCDLETIPPGESRITYATFVVSSSVTVPATAINTATVTTNATDVDPVNNSSTVTTDIFASPASDVSIAKIDSTDPVTAGTRFNYVLIVTNRGPEPAADVSVSDPLPPGVTLIAATPQQGTCSGTTTVTCTLGTLAAGSETVIVLSVEAPGLVPTPNPMLNTATATTTSIDPVPANNSATAATTVTGPIADLAIAKTPNLSTVTAGTPLVWTIVVGNSGPSRVPNALVTDLLPADFTAATWTCVATPGSACPASGAGSISTIVNLAAGGGATFTVGGTVAPSAIGVLSNAAVIGIPVGLTDVNPANNSATSVVPIATSADLSIVKTGPASIFSGTVLTYTITVANAGPSTATGVAVADPTPAGLVFLSNTGGCTTPFPCALGTLNPGDVRTITARYTVPDGTPGPIANIATVSSAVSDPVAADNTSRVDTFIVTPQTDLSITKTGPASVARGALIPYQLVVHNAGPVDATSVDTSDALPGGTTFVSVTPPALTTCTTPAAGSAGVVACRTPLLPSGADLVIPIVVQANVDLPLGTRLTNIAIVSSAVADFNTANNRAESRTAIASPTDADLSISDDDTPDPVVVGSSVTHLLTITNHGPAVANAVTVVGTLPAGLVLAAPAQGACAGSTCTLGTLAVGASTTVTIVATATTPGIFTTAAVVSATEHDPVLLNNATIQRTTAGAATDADLLVEMIGPTTASPGQAAVYQTRVTNRGPGIAFGTELDVALPAAIVFGANSGDCQTPFVCALGTLAVGDTRTILTTFTVDPAAPVPATVSSTATATSLTADPNAANNSATVATALYAGPSADLEITKTGSPVVVVAGAALTYTMTVTNHGPTAATSVTVDDAVPAGVNVLSAAATQGTCTVTSSLTCVLGDMPVGTSALIEIIAESPTSTPVPNPMVNTATVSGGPGDPVAANNTSSALTSVGVAVAELSVTKTPSVAHVDAAASLSWTIVVSNNGPSDAFGTSVNDPFPAGFTSATWACTPGAGSACGATSGAGSIATTVNLPVGGSVTFVATGVVAGSTVGPLTNTVTVAPPADTFDVEPTDNTAVSTVTVDPVADLSIRKTGPGRLRAGGLVVYTLSIGNAGPSTADGVTVSDSTPMGLTFVSTSGDCTTPFPCVLGNLPAAGTRTIAATYRVANGPAAPDVVTNIATVASGGLTRELNPIDDVGIAIGSIVKRTSCDVDGDGVDEIVTGAGPAGEAHVRVLSRAGGTLTELAGFYAYDVNFHGGVFVACGDVTGDGIAEIITGAGPGGGPHVRVLEVTGGNVTELAGFYAYDELFHGGVHVAVGDIDGDGIAEIITGAGPGGGPHVVAYKFDNGAITVAASFYAYEQAFHGGVNVAAGDVNGDGIAEIVTGAGPDGGPHVRVFTLTGGAIAELVGFYAYEQAFHGGVSVATGDLDGDGVEEVITGAGPRGGPHVRVLRVGAGTVSEVVGFYAYEQAFHGGVWVGTGDIDGDGVEELITGAGPDGGPHVRVLRVNGATVTELFGFYAYEQAFHGGVSVASLDSPRNYPSAPEQAPGRRPQRDPPALALTSARRYAPESRRFAEWSYPVGMY